jgi:hypothetical protein
MRITLLLLSLAVVATPLRAQAPVEVHAGDAIVNAARVTARTDTFALTTERTAAVLIIRTAMAGTAAAPAILRVERIVTVTEVEVSVDSFAARLPMLQPVFDVSRHPNRTRMLFFSARGVTGKTERDGTRTTVNATLDPPAFYGNSADLVFASLPLEQGSEFDVAMWDADSGPWHLRLHPAVAETTSTVDGATCDAWRVDAEEHGNASTYWIERSTGALLAYRSSDGLEIRIAHHAGCTPGAGDARPSR